MPEAKRIEALTDWIEYPLQPSDMIGGATAVKFRLRYIDALDVADIMHEAGMRPIAGAREIAMRAVAAWDLTGDKGKAIPVMDETKEFYLRPLLAEPMPITDEARKKAEEDGSEPIADSLAFAVARDAQRRGLFLKN